MSELDSENTDDDGDNVEYVTSVTLVPTRSVKPTSSPSSTEIYAERIVNDEPVKFQLDCGATINILPEKDAQSCDLKSATKRLRMWNGSEVIPLGTTRVIVRNPRNYKRYCIEFVLVCENLVPIIGSRVAQHIRLINIHDDNFVPATPPNL